MEVLQNIEQALNEAITEINSLNNLAVPILCHNVFSLPSFLHPCFPQNGPE